MTELVVCCGVGGVGKTTTAAAIAVGHALSGKRVVVLTIDPARRLADALGVQLRGVDVVRVPLAGPGSLDATMLDRKAMFDAVIRRFAPDEETAARLVANRYYAAVSERLGGSQEYMAMERLYELVEEGSWDVVVVDTPPARHALDFFQAPERVRGVFDRSVLKVLVQPGRGLFAATTRRVAGLVERMAGDRVLQDIGEFFSLLAGMSSGFRHRSQAVHELMRSERAHYLLVTAASAPARTDALEFLEVLQDQGMRLSGLVVNRVAEEPGDVAGLEDVDLDPAWREALRALAASAAEAAARHREAIEALRVHAPEARVWRVPDQPGGVRTLEGLAELARHLPPAA